MKPQQVVYSGMILLALIGCAATWPYPERVLSVQEGLLKGPEPKDDLPLSVCDPDEVSQAQCYVMLREEYRAMRKDYNNLKVRLKELEAGCQK